MKQYHDLLLKLLNKRDLHGLRDNRTDTPTTALFCEAMRWDLSEGFPLITTKKVNFRAVAHELLWFLSGDTNIKYLLENDVHIWTEWPHKRFNEMFGEDMDIKEFEKRIVANDYTEVKRLGKSQTVRFGDLFGDLGPVYGHQWRRFGEHDVGAGDEHSNGEYDEYKPGFDQITWVQNEIKTKPHSRRLIVSSWNPNDVGKSALPPCHNYFQFFVENGKLSLMWNQRSADFFVGIPFNIASYALLCHMMAKACGLEVGELVWHGVDVHLYENHVDMALEQLSRQEYPLPTLKINGEFDSVLDIKFENIELIGYQHHPFIKAPVAV